MATLLASSVAAQQSVDAFLSPLAPLSASTVPAMSGAPVGNVPEWMNMPNAVTMPTNVLFYEDFANGFNGNNGVGSWTAEDTGGGAIWQYVNANGDGYYANGVASGVQPPAGEFSTNVTSLASTTTANGWMIFDCDYYHTPLSNGYGDVQGWITSPLLDFSGNASVLVSWEQYFRYCCYSIAPVHVQVSNDGGFSWTTFDAHGSFLESTNVQSANPLETTVDISCAAAGHNNVLVRFAYLQPEEVGGGYSHYFWGIDDVVIYENDVLHDLVALELQASTGWSAFGYSAMPLEQMLPAEYGGMPVSLKFRNEGSADQTNAVIQVEVLDASGTVTHSVSEYYGLIPAGANSPWCPSSEWEQWGLATGWVPSEVGSYTVRATILSDNTDATPLNNVINAVIEITEGEMGHDTEPLDLELGSGTADGGFGYEPSGHGNFFEMSQEGSMAYGLAVKFGPNAGGPGLEFETRLYSYTGEYVLPYSPYETNYWTYDTDWTPADIESSEFVYLPFTEPIPLSTGMYYFAAVMTDYDTEHPLTVLANANSNNDNSVGRYLQSSNGEYWWFFNQQHTPAIRLVLDPSYFPGWGCTDAEACNYDELAETDDGSCEYLSCAECSEISVTFRVDMSQVSAISPNGVHVVGDFQGWSPGSTEMLDEDGDLVYTYTTTLPNTGPGSLAYKYINGNSWGDDQDILPGEGCADVNGNRLLEINQCNIVTGVADTGAPHCFNSCGECVVPTQVTFRVNMSMQDVISENGVCIAGSFQGWAPGANMLSDEDGDLIYETTLELMPGTYEYKFINGTNWSGGGAGDVDNELISGECAAPGTDNRQIVVGTEAMDVLHCYNLCYNCAGCMDEAACNFDPSAFGAANEFCTYPGCEDPMALNYNPAAGCAGECTYSTYNCSTIGEASWAGELTGLYPAYQSAMYGVSWDGEWVFNVGASVVEPSSGVTYGIHHLAGVTVSGVPGWMDLETPEGSLSPSGQYCIPASGVPNAVGVQALTLSGEVFISIFGQPFSIGIQSFTAVLEVSENPNPIPGCTYANALNYSALATVDDGGCQFAGCTDSAAVNFTPLATLDDGSCLEACNDGPSSGCASDSNGDGVVTVSDLLILLGEFGADCL